MRVAQRLLIVTLVLMVMLASTGCGTTPDDPPDKQTDDKPPPQTDDTTPESGGTVTIGIWSEPSNFNPLIWPTQYDRYVSFLVYNRLVKPDERLGFEPDLAESWEFSEDGRTVTFTLKQGVKWHDGTPLTAEDVAFTFKSLAHPLYDGGSYSRVDTIAGAREFRAGEADDVAGIKVLNERQVSFTTVDVSATIMLAFVQTEIIPKHILGDVPPDQWTSHPTNTQQPIGTGPFRFVTYETSRFVEFAANDDYFEGRPNIDKLIYRIGDQHAMLAAFMKQEVDIVPVPLGEIDVVEDLAFAELKVYDSVGIQYVGLNCLIPAFSDTKVRQAMAHAINKEQIVRSLLRGYATTIDAPFARILWPYPDNVQGFNYDVNRAKQLLDEAGWTHDEQLGVRAKDGVPMVFEMLYPTGNLVRMQYVPILQQNLGAVGIRTELRAVDFPTMVGHLLPRDAQGALRAVTADDFEIYILGINLTTGDPDSLQSYFHSAYMPPDGYNFVSFSDPRIDELYEESSRTVDFEQRKQMVHDLMTVLAEEVPWIPLYSDKDIWAVNTRVAGFDPGVHGLTHNVIDWHVK